MFTKFRLSTRANCKYQKIFIKLRCANMVERIKPFIPSSWSYTHYTEWIIHQNKKSGSFLIKLNSTLPLEIMTNRISAWRFLNRLNRPLNFRGCGLQVVRHCCCCHPTSLCWPYWQRRIGRLHGRSYWTRWLFLKDTYVKLLVKLEREILA